MWFHVLSVTVIFALIIIIIIIRKRRRRSKDHSSLFSYFVFA